MTRPKVLNLDDPALGQWSLLFSFRNVRTVLDRERLERLLALEQDQLAHLAGDGPGGDSGPEPSLRTRQIPDDQVTHGSLSGRITKIHNYASRQRALRPAHAGLLGEFLAAFDWVLPEHTSNKIPTMLTDIAGWDGVSPDLKRQIAEFLRRYQVALDKRG